MEKITQQTLPLSACLQHKTPDWWNKLKLSQHLQLPRKGKKIGQTMHKKQSSWRDCLTIPGAF